MFHSTYYGVNIYRSNSWLRWNGKVGGFVEFHAESNDRTTTKTNHILIAFVTLCNTVGREHTPQLAGEYMNHFRYYWMNTRNGMLTTKREKIHAMKVFSKIVAIYGK